VTDDNVGIIYEFTPGGVQSTFASGLSHPSDLAFDSADNLFVVNTGDGTVVEFKAGGGQSTFVTGLSNPASIAIQGQTLPVPEPSALGLLAVVASVVVVRRVRRAAASQS
jgi:hypothetical protein